MKACLISCFGYYEQRLKYMEHVLKEKGYEVILIVSDFDHILKKKIQKQREQVIVVPVPAYKKNISFRRMFSHWMFSKRTFARLKKEQPDLVYSTIPPNCLCRYLSKYKRKYTCKLIFDIYDLWPESFPIAHTELPPFNIWKGFRNHHLRNADYVLLECAYYKSVLKEVLDNGFHQVVYLCKKPLEKPIQFQYREDRIHVCYLGSINHIIDMDSIVNLLVAIKKRKAVFLHIIGDGDNTQKFLQLLQEAHVDYNYYGSIFSEKEKRQIFEKCLFGINIYKKETSIGLTMKSVDYFQAGLPLLTYHIRDIDQLTQKHGLGYVVENMEETADALAHLSYDRWNLMSQNVRKIFEQQFSSRVCEQKLCSIVESVMEND